MNVPPVPGLDGAFVARVAAAARDVAALEPSSEWVEVFGPAAVVDLFREALPEDGTGLRSLGGTPVVFRRDEGAPLAELVMLVSRFGVGPRRFVASLPGLSPAFHEVFVRLRLDGLSLTDAFRTARAVLA